MGRPAQNSHADSSVPYAAAPITSGTHDDVSAKPLPPTVRSAAPSRSNTRTTPSTPSSARGLNTPAKPSPPRIGTPPETPAGKGQRRSAPHAELAPSGRASGAPSPGV